MGWKVGIENYSVALCTLDFEPMIHCHVDHDLVHPVFLILKHKATLFRAVKQPSLVMVYFLCLTQLLVQIFNPPLHLCVVYVVNSVREDGPRIVSSMTLYPVSILLRQGLEADFACLTF